MRLLHKEVAAGVMVPTLTTFIVMVAEHDEWGFAAVFAAAVRVITGLSGGWPLLFLDPQDLHDWPGPAVVRAPARGGGGPGAGPATGRAAISLHGSSSSSNSSSRNASMSSIINSGSGGCCRRSASRLHRALRRACWVQSSLMVKLRDGGKSTVASIALAIAVPDANYLAE
jgi:hypothetical protein